MTPLDICIDVSDAQGAAIDWPAVRAAGIRIAFIKATEGTTFVAKTWERNRREAMKAGLAVVPYHFLRPVDPRAQIAHFRDVAGLEEGMAFALDWEGAAAATCTAVACEEVGEELALLVKRKPIGYWGLPGSTPEHPTPKMLLWDEWVPRYQIGTVASWEDVSAARRANPGSFWRRYNPLPAFAQYTASGRVSGITGDVDRSVAFFDDADAAIAWVRGAGAATAIIAGPVLSAADAVGLLAPSAPPADIPATIRVLQAACKAAGHDPGAIDGIMGPRTYAAVLAAQGAGR